MLQNGIVSTPPDIKAPEQIDFVKNQRYLNGWFGKQIPLNAIEIDDVTFNAQKLMVKVVLEIRFSQVSQSKDLRKYFQKGEKILS